MSKITFPFYKFYKIHKITSKDFNNIDLHYNQFIYNVLKLKGTSAAAPLFAGLTARLMSLKGVASVQSMLQNGGYYTTLYFNDITSGNNGGFKTSVGWDPVTGLGSFSSLTPPVLPTTGVTEKSSIESKKPASSTFPNVGSSANAQLSFISKWFLCLIIFVNYFYKVNF